MSTHSEKTCGDLYLEGITEFGGTEAEYWAYAAGFVSGQAEKIYNGVCVAAMFRPSDENAGRLQRIVERIAPRYGLRLITTAATRFPGEIWIYCTLRQTYFNTMFDALCAEEVNSPKWHWIRARLCGIPLAMVDESYHLRKNFNQPCDVVNGGES